MPTEKSCGSGSETQLVPSFLHKYQYQDKLLPKQADFASGDVIDDVLYDHIMPLNQGCNFSRILQLEVFSLMWTHFTIHMTLVKLVGLFQFSPHLRQIGM